MVAERGSDRRSGHRNEASSQRLGERVPDHNNRQPAGSGQLWSVVQAADQMGLGDAAGSPDPCALRLSVEGKDQVDQESGYGLLPVLHSHPASDVVLLDPLPTQPSRSNNDFQSVSFILHDCKWLELLSAHSLRPCENQQG